MTLSYYLAYFRHQAQHALILLAVILYCLPFADKILNTLPGHCLAYRQYLLTADFNKGAHSGGVTPHLFIQAAC